MAHYVQESPLYGDCKIFPSASHRCSRGQSGGCVLHRSVLHAHQVQFVLQVLESRQRAMHFFDQLAGEDVRCLDLLLLDYTLPGLDTRELLQWIKAVPVYRRLRIIAMTGSDDPDIQAEALAFGADAFFRKPVSFQRFLALGDLIKVVVFGHGSAE